MADPVTIKVPFGIAGDGLREIERAVPADEPPALATNDKLSVIGKPTPRLDGRLKVTGAARYTADVRLPGMLFARIVRSTSPHARLRAIDTSAAERVPGVRSVQIVDHLLGGAKLRDSKQEPASRLPVVRYVGQPIAAVAATTQAVADEAARLVRVEYEALPFVVDVEEARRPESAVMPATIVSSVPVTLRSFIRASVLANHCRPCARPGATSFAARTRGGGALAHSTRRVDSPRTRSPLGSRSPLRSQSPLRPARISSGRAMPTWRHTIRAARSRITVVGTAFSSPKVATRYV